MLVLKLRFFFFSFLDLFYTFIFNNAIRPRNDTAALCQILQQIFQDFVIELVYYSLFVQKDQRPLFLR